MSQQTTMNAKLWKWELQTAKKNCMNKTVNCTASWRLPEWEVKNRLVPVKCSQTSVDGFEGQFTYRRKYSSYGVEVKRQDTHQCCHYHLFQEVATTKTFTDYERRWHSIMSNFLSSCMWLRKPTTSSSMPPAGDERRQVVLEGDAGGKAETHTL